MADCFTLCQRCDVPIPGGERTRPAHDLDCDRFLNGSCRCDGWLCRACSPEPECTPLAAALAVARDDVRARAEAAEVAAAS